MFLTISCCFSLTHFAFYLGEAKKRSIITSFWKFQFNLCNCVVDSLVRIHLIVSYLVLNFVIVVSIPVMRLYLYFPNHWLHFPSTTSPSWKIADFIFDFYLFKSSLTLRRWAFYSFLWAFFYIFDILTSEIENLLEPARPDPKEKTVDMFCCNIEIGVASMQAHVSERRHIQYTEQETKSKIGFVKSRYFSLSSSDCELTDRRTHGHKNWI